MKNIGIYIFRIVPAFVLLMAAIGLLWLSYYIGTPKEDREYADFTAFLRYML